MRNRYMVIYLLSLLFFATSCVEEFEAEIPEEEENVLVVEGNILSNSSSTLYISHSSSFKRMNQHPIENAKVTLMGSDGEKEDFGGGFNGQYRLGRVQLKSDVEYWIEIKVGKYTYESEHQKPLDAPQIDTLKYQQVRADKKVEILVSTVPSANADEMVYTSWDFLEAWEIHTPNCAEYEWGCWDNGETGYIKLNKTQFTNVGWKTQNSLSSVTFSSKGKVQNEVVHTIDHTDDRLQTCYFIRVKNSAISRAEYEYYATRNQLSSNMGGLFSPMPAELPTNIRCINGSMKAVGFVGIRGKVNEAEIHILKKNVYYEDTHKKVSPPEEALEGKSPSQLWNEGYRILFYDPNDHRVRWTYAWWVDCRVAPWFASLSKPPFWNDNWTKE